MTEKTEALYSLVFAHVKEQFPSMRHTVRVIVTDFERALQNAFAAAFAEADIVGCWFHDGQVIFLNN